MWLWGLKLATIASRYGGYLPVGHSVLKCRVVYRTNGHGARLQSSALIFIQCLIHGALLSMSPSSDNETHCSGKM